MHSRLPIALALLFAFTVAAPFAHAEGVLKPVPVPDTSKLPKARADELRKSREDFDKTRAELIGDPLAEAYAVMASIYAQSGFYDAAAVALEDSAVLAPRDGRWAYAQGVVAKMQQSPAAKTYFENALTLNQEYLPIRLAVVEARIQSGDLDGARTLLADYVQKHTDQAPPYALLGDIALRQKRYPEAIDHYKRALLIDPRANKLNGSLADAYQASGDARAAADARAKAGANAPGLSDPIGQGLVAQSAAPATPADELQKNVGAAVFLLGERQYDAARKSLDAALKQKPNDAALLGLYARIDAASGNLASAKARANAAVAADANNALAHLSLASVLEMSNDDAGAQREYEQAIRLDGKLVDPRMRLGLLSMRNGRNDEAATQFRSLIQADPANAEAWTRLVAVQVAAGRCYDAMKDVNGGLAKDANNKFLLQLFVRLASTCNKSSVDEKRMALDYGGKLYKSSDLAQIGEAYALALAANGKWDDAVKTQQAAMFILVRNGLSRNVSTYRETLQNLQAKKLPDRPWPASSPVFKPERPAPDPTPAPAAAAPTPAPKK